MTMFLHEIANKAVSAFIAFLLLALSQASFGLVYVETNTYGYDVAKYSVVEQNAECKGQKLSYDDSSNLRSCCSDSLGSNLYEKAHDGLLFVLVDGFIATKGAERAATGFKGSKGFELKNAPYQKVRNEATSINGREFSGHALDQMQNRGIMPSVVENTLKTGTTFKTRAGTTGFYDAVNKVRVITNSETGKVVTVIRGAPK